MLLYLLSNSFDRLGCLYPENCCGLGGGIAHLTHTNHPHSCVNAASSTPAGVTVCECVCVWEPRHRYSGQFAGTVRALCHFIFSPKARSPKQFSDETACTLLRGMSFMLCCIKHVNKEACTAPNCVQEWLLHPACFFHLARFVPNMAQQIWSNFVAPRRFEPTRFFHRSTLILLARYCFVCVSASCHQTAEIPVN